MPEPTVKYEIVGYVRKVTVIHDDDFQVCDEAGEEVLGTFETLDQALARMDELTE